MRSHSIFLAFFLATGLFSSCSYRFYSIDCEKPVPGNLVRHADLPPVLAESSGLLYLNDRILTFNDSGGEPALYCVDGNTGDLISKTVISNATNTDWEESAQDYHTSE